MSAIYRCPRCNQALGVQCECWPPWNLAARDVLDERKRQRLVEGWTAEHDDDPENHGPYDLAMAAVCYALPEGNREPAPWCAGIPRLWPWSVATWKPKDRRRDLVRAAALLLAEIDRIDRSGPLPAAPPSAGETT